MQPLGLYCFLCRSQMKWALPSGLSKGSMHMALHTLAWSPLLIRLRPHCAHQHFVWSHGKQGKPSCCRTPTRRDGQGWTGKTPRLKWWVWTLTHRHTLHLIGEGAPPANFLRVDVYIDEWALPFFPDWAFSHSVLLLHNRFNFDGGGHGLRGRELVMDLMKSSCVDFSRLQCLIAEFVNGKALQSP